MNRSSLFPVVPAILIAALAAGCEEGTSLAGDAVGDGIVEDAGPDAPDDGPRSRPVALVPSCVHVPALVGAGSFFPIAVLGETEGCVRWDRAEVSASGFDIEVRLVGVEDLVGPCPGCLETYVGLIWLEAPNPGPYTVRVAGRPAETVVASGGAYEDPVCSTACPAFNLGAAAWTLARVSAEDVRSSCGDYVNVGTPVSFAGSCREWTASGEDWTFPARALHCTDAELYFGPSAPYDVDATLCPGRERSAILGISRRPATAGAPAELFLLESD